MHALLLTRLRAAGEIEWSRAVVDSSHLQAKKEGSETGPSPVDRGRAQATSTSHVRSSTRRVRGKPAGCGRPVRRPGGGVLRMRSGCRRSRHHRRLAGLDPLGDKASGRARKRASYGEPRLGEVETRRVRAAGRIPHPRAGVVLPRGLPSCGGGTVLIEEPQCSPLRVISRDSVDFLVAAVPERLPADARYVRHHR